MKSAPNFHEGFDHRPHRNAPSDRAFGFLMGAILGVLSLMPLLNGREPRLWLLAIGAMVFIAALLRPSMLARLNRGWFRLGLLLGKITNPFVMAVIFAGGVVPTALVMRMMGRDPMLRRFDPTAKTYWTERRPPGPPPESMRNQF